MSFLPLETLLTRFYTSGGVFNKESKQHSVGSRSFGGFFSCSGVSVGESNVQFSGSLDNSESFVDGDVLSNFTAENSVVHEKNLNIHLVGDWEFLESVREDVSGLMVLFVTDEHLLWLSTSKSSSGRAINTSNGSVTVWVDSFVLVSLESTWDFGNLLSDLSLVQRSRCHIVYIYI